MAKTSGEETVTRSCTPVVKSDSSRVIMHRTPFGSILHSPLFAAGRSAFPVRAGG